MPFGISVRGHLAYLLVYTCCLLAVCQIEIPKTIDAMAATALIFYFKDAKTSPPTPPSPSSS